MGVTNWYQSFIDYRTQTYLEVDDLASSYSPILCLSSCSCYLINFYASYVSFYYEILPLI
jgi:hypothetical protein